MTRYVLMILLLAWLLASGCDQVSSPLSVPIGKVLASPRNYEGKTITLSGTVGETMSLFVIKAFLLSDDTGQIFVVTDRILPKQGEKMRAKGTVVEAFSLGNQTLTVFKEQEVPQR